MVTPDNGRRAVTAHESYPSRSSMIFLLCLTLADLVHRHPTGVVAWWAGLGVAVEVPCMPTTSRGFPRWLPKRRVATPPSRLCELYCGLRIATMYSSNSLIAGVAVGNVRVSDARLVEGHWVGLAFAARSPAGSPRTAAVMRGSPGELGKELGVGVGLAEAVEEHVDGLLAVPAVEGPAQGAGGYRFLGGQQ